MAFITFTNLSFLLLSTVFAYYKNCPPIKPRGIYNFEGNCDIDIESAHNEICTIKCIGGNIYKTTTDKIRLKCSQGNWYFLDDPSWFAGEIQCQLSPQDEKTVANIYTYYEAVNKNVENKCPILELGETVRVSPQCNISSGIPCLATCSNGNFTTLPEVSAVFIVCDKRTGRNMFSRKDSHFLPLNFSLKCHRKCNKIMAIAFHLELLNGCNKGNDVSHGSVCNFQCSQSEKRSLQCVDGIWKSNEANTLTTYGSEEGKLPFIYCPFANNLAGYCKSLSLEDDSFEYKNCLLIDGFYRCFYSCKSGYELENSAIRTYHQNAIYGVVSCFENKFEKPACRKIGSIDNNGSTRNTGGTGTIDNSGNTGDSNINEKFCVPLILPSSVAFVNKCSKGVAVKHNEKCVLKCLTGNFNLLGRDLVQLACQGGNWYRYRREGNVIGYLNLNMEELKCPGSADVDTVNTSCKSLPTWQNVRFHGCDLNNEHTTWCRFECPYRLFAFPVDFEMHSYTSGMIECREGLWEQPFCLGFNEWIRNAYRKYM